MNLTFIFVIFILLNFQLSIIKIDCKKPLFKVFALLLAEEELPYSFDLYCSSLKIAEERVNSLYKNFNIELIIKRTETKCDSSAAPVLAAERYYIKGFDSLLGPSCTKGLEPVARMASYWNTPLCTPGGIDMKFKEKSVFTTLTRITFSLDQIGHVIDMVLRQFNWSNISLVVDEAEELYSSLRESLEKTLQEESDNITLNVFTFSRTSTKPQFGRILKRVSKVSRIVIFIANGDTVRKILLEAQKLSMGNGDYAFLAIDFTPSREVYDEFSWFRANDTNNENARHIFDSLLIISIRQPIGPNYESFINETISRTLESSPESVDINYDSINLIITGAYDCIITYAWALNQTISENGNSSDGSKISQKMWNVSFTEGVIEKFHINSNGDRLADFNLKDYNPTENGMKIVATYYGITRVLQLDPEAQIHWPNGKQTENRPFCGFTGEDPKCKTHLSSLLKKYGILYGSACFLLTVVCIICYKYYKQMELESELSSNWWRIRWDEIILEDRPPKSFHQSFGTLAKSDEMIQRSHDHQIGASSNRRNNSMIADPLPGTIVGHYKGMRVAIKKLNLKRILINRELLMEMKFMRDLNHENLIRFIGLCPEEMHVACVNELSTRGCLRDLLQNDEITIDWAFRFCIISDIIQGVLFLHSSPIEYHGRLKSTNCVIDGRFVVKLTDFGLSEVAKQLNRDSPQVINNDSSGLLWTSPEHLRELSQNIGTDCGSQKGDVYSFAIILQEIISRSAPFESFQKFSRSRPPLTVEEIVERIRTGTTPPFRPEVSLNECPADLLDIVIQCWDEDPNQRPSFSSIRQQFKKANMGYDNDNFLDNLLSRMENYTNNLEQLADQRTSALLEEKQKSEQLLNELLPQSVADQLKTGQTVRPEYFDCVTICFTDIVGFTTFSAQCTHPMQVVNLLNDLYTCFDGIIAKYDVYKVETIGDAYMSVSGCPVRNGNLHAKEIARMSLALLETIDKFQVKYRQDYKIRLRIGVHSGSVVAGVVGLKMPRYCLFGDTVNLTQKMESTGQAMKIHISSTTRDILETFGNFILEKRGEIELKDLKMKLETYWLCGEEKVDELIAIDGTPDILIEK